MSKKFTAHFRDGKLVRFKGNLNQFSSLVHELRSQERQESLEKTGEPKNPHTLYGLPVEKGATNPQPVPGTYEHIKFGSVLGPNQFSIPTSAINWNQFHTSKEMEIAKVEGVKEDEKGMTTELSFSDENIENCRKMGIKVPYEVLVGKINEQISGILPVKIGQFMVENLDERFIRKHPCPESFHQAIAYSFKWDQTPQGFNFWRNVAAQQFEAALYELSLREG